MNNIGILDPKGLKKNPFSNKNYTQTYKNLAVDPNDPGKGWATLPLYKKAKECIDTIKNNQVSLFIIGTGAGKTVLVPKYTLHTLNYKGKIAVTIPKKIVVESAAQYAASSLDVELGEEVGYAHKSKKVRSDKTKLLFTTDGSIVSKLMADITLKEYDALIIDEAHERNVNIDFIFLLIKKTLKLRPNFKLIIMSATINPDIFLKYFEKDGFTMGYLNEGGVTPFPIEEHWLKTPIKKDDVIEKSVDTCVNLIADGVQGDMIIFVTTTPETKQVCILLEKKLQYINKNKNNPLCIQIYGEASEESKNLVKSANLYLNRQNTKGRPYTRRIIVGTNAIESSLTVAGCKIVIDNGYALTESYDPLYCMQKLYTERITEAARLQRKGRVGRTSPGIVYYMYTKDEMNAMKKYPPPAIQNTNLDSFFLRMFSLPDVKNVSSLVAMINRLIEPPSDDFIKSGIRTLMQLDILNEIKIGNKKEGILTEAGEKMSSFASGYSPQSCRAQFESYKYNVSGEVCLITTMIEMSGGKLSEFFYAFKPNPMSSESETQQRKKYEAIKKKFNHKNGDLMGLYKIATLFDDYRRQHNGNMLQKWCDDNYLYKKRIQTASIDSRSHRNRLLEIMGGKNVINNKEGGRSGSTLERRIEKCLMAGYCTNISRKEGNEFKNCFPIKTTKFKIDRDSFLNFSSSPNYLYYSILQDTNGNIKGLFCQKIGNTLLKDIKDIIDVKYLVNECKDRRKSKIKL